MLPSIFSPILIFTPIISFPLLYIGWMATAPIQSPPSCPVKELAFNECFMALTSSSSILWVYVFLLGLFHSVMLPRRHIGSNIFFSIDLGVWGAVCFDASIFLLEPSCTSLCEECCVDSGCGVGDGSAFGGAWLFFPKNLLSQWIVHIYPYKYYIW